MLRISIKAQSAHQVILAVHGKIAGTAVPLLQKEGDLHLQVTSRLVLALDAVPFIDRQGLALLKRWQNKGLVLYGGSAFLKALLVTEGLHSN